MGEDREKEWALQQKQEDEKFVKNVEDLPRGTKIEWEKNAQANSNQAKNLRNAIKSIFAIMGDVTEIKFQKFDDDHVEILIWFDTEGEAECPALLKDLKIGDKQIQCTARREKKYIIIMMLQY